MNGDRRHREKGIEEALAHNIYRRTHLEHAATGKSIDEINNADAVRWNATLTRSAGPGAANSAIAS